MSIRILALDVATKTGAAYGPSDGTPTSWTWKLKSPEDTPTRAARRLGIELRDFLAASKVKQTATPSVQKAVEDGELSLNAAAKIAELPAADQEVVLSEDLFPRQGWVAITPIIELAVFPIIPRVFGLLSVWQNFFARAQKLFGNAPGHAMRRRLISLLALDCGGAAGGRLLSAARHGCLDQPAKAM